jgi:hypothetical protein
MHAVVALSTLVFRANTATSRLPHCERPYHQGDLKRALVEILPRTVARGCGLSNFRRQTAAEPPLDRGGALYYLQLLVEEYPG